MSILYSYNFIHTDGYSINTDRNCCRLYNSSVLYGLNRIISVAFVVLEGGGRRVWGYGFMVNVGLLSVVSIFLAIFAFSSFWLHQNMYAQCEFHTRRTHTHTVYI